MKKKKVNDCVELKNKIQQSLYSKYQNLTDEERESTILSNLSASQSPVAKFWKRQVLRLADTRAGYKKAKE